MKKNGLLAYVALGIVFVLFNVVAFAAPTEKTATFWIAYAFTVIAFVIQIALWKIAFNKKDSLKSKFLGASVISVGIIYLIIQLIAFAVFMICSDISAWIALIVCAVILCVSLLCVIAGKAGANSIDRVEEKIKAKRAFIQFLQVDIEMLAESESDAEIKTLLKKLAEKVRFSDPMSHEMLGELESRITGKVEEMKTSVDKKKLISEVEMLLAERNKKCKILK